MRTLAEYILRGRTQATLVAMVAAALPLLYWLAAATVGLVTLRKGSQAGLVPLLWAALPASAWWILKEEPRVLLVLLLTYALAGMLRKTVSWPVTLVGGVGLAVLLGMLFPVILPELLRGLVAELAEIQKSIAPEWVEQMGSELNAVLATLLAAMFAASVLLIGLLSLMLARFWQAVLFNPGGFRKEFHELRLPPWYVAVILLVVLLAPGLGYQVILLGGALAVPLLIAGIALIHGYVGKRNLGRQWLFAFYAVMVLMGPSTLVLLMLVAMIDSFVDIRRRVERPSQG